MADPSEPAPATAAKLDELAAEVAERLDQLSIDVAERLDELRSGVAIDVRESLAAAGTWPRLAPLVLAVAVGDLIVLASALLAARAW